MRREDEDLQNERVFGVQCFLRASSFQLQLQRSATPAFLRARAAWLWLSAAVHFKDSAISFPAEACVANRDRKRKRLLQRILLGVSALPPRCLVCCLPNGVRMRLRPIPVLVGNVDVQCSANACARVNNHGHGLVDVSMCMCSQYRWIMHHGISGVAFALILRQPDSNDRLYDSNHLSPHHYLRFYASGSFRRAAFPRIRTRTRTRPRTASPGSDVPANFVPTFERSRFIAQHFDRDFL